MNALRYHFISRPEIKILLIVVNLFTILSAILFYMHKIQSLSFLLFKEENIEKKKVRKERKN